MRKPVFPNTVVLFAAARAALAARAARAAAHKPALGLPEDSARPDLVEGCSAGKNRTPGKHTLLRALEDAGGNW